MDLIRKFVSGGSRRIHARVITPFVMNHLLRETEEPLRSVGLAFASTRQKKLSPEEALMVNRIEALRTRLASSSSRVAVQDHGMGPSGEDKPAAAGNTVTREVSEVCRVSSFSSKWSLLLFRLIRELRPDVCLELGTSLGISAAYQAAALQINGNGTLVSLEGSESSCSHREGSSKQSQFAHCRNHHRQVSGSP